MWKIINRVYYCQSREAVMCASALNCAVLALLLIGVILPYWTWGNCYQASNTASVYYPVSASFGPWTAGWLWSAFYVPCNCANGICYNLCTVSTSQVLWNYIGASEACDPLSGVFLYWSGPNGYCSFPPGYDTAFSFPQPWPLPSVYPLLPPNPSRVPAGTTFNVPEAVKATQGLTIVATIACFFGIIAGCADAGTQKRMLIFPAAAACWTFIAFAFALSSICVWAAGIPIVQKAQSTPPQTWIPVWVTGNGTSNFLTALPVKQMWLGSAWGCFCAAVIIIFFTMLVHCISLIDADAEMETILFNRSKGSTKQPSTSPSMGLPPPAISPHPVDRTMQV